MATCILVRPFLHMLARHSLSLHVKTYPQRAILPDFLRFCIRSPHPYQPHFESRDVLTILREFITRSHVIFFPLNMATNFNTLTYIRLPSLGLVQIHGHWPMVPTSRRGIAALATDGLEGVRAAVHDTCFKLARLSCSACTSRCLLGWAVGPCWPCRESYYSRVRVACAEVEFERWVYRRATIGSTIWVGFFCKGKKMLSRFLYLILIYNAARSRLAVDLWAPIV